MTNEELRGLNKYLDDIGLENVKNIVLIKYGATNDEIFKALFPNTELREDAISREQAKSDFADWFGYGYRDNAFYKRLCDLPPVTPKQSDKKCEDCAHYGVFSSDCARCDDDCTNWTPSGAKMEEQA